MDDGSGLPSALAATSLDAHMLNSVTAQFFFATWFSIVGSDAVSKFHRCVMPWDPEADQLFTLVISMLLNTLLTQLATEGIEASVPHVPPDENICSARRGALATWNPDIALAISVHADQAINTLRRTVLVRRRVFRQLRLLLYFCAGKPRLLWMPWALVHVLYAWLSGSMALRPFVFVAPTSTWVAFVCAGQHVTRSPCSLCSKHRAARMRRSLPWPKLNCTQMREIEGTYRHPARVASGCPCPDVIPAKSTAQMLSKVSQPSLWPRLVFYIFPDS